MRAFEESGLREAEQDLLLHDLLQNQLLFQSVRRLILMNPIFQLRLLKT